MYFTTNESLKNEPPIGCIKCLFSGTFIEWISFSTILSGFSLNGSSSNILGFNISGDPFKLSIGFVSDFK